MAIEVRIMEVVLDERMEMGVNRQTFLDGEVQFSQDTPGTPPTPESGFAQMVANTTHLYGVVQALSVSGDRHTVSSPQVTTLNSQKAIVRIMREDVYSLASVQPAIVSNGLAAEAVVSWYAQRVPVGVVTSPNLDAAPVVAARELDTVGRIGDGQAMLIAGLLLERERSVRSGVPILKDLPVPGALFGRVTREKYNVELVMMLTPAIMDDARVAEAATKGLTSMEARR